MDTREDPVRPAPDRHALALRRALCGDVHERGGRWTCLFGGGARATVSIMVIAEGIARVRIHTGGPRPEPVRGDAAPGGDSFILPEALEPPPPDDAFPCGRTARPGGWSFETPRLRVDVDEDPWRVAFFRPDGELLTEQIGDDADLRGTALAPSTGFEVEGDASAPVRRVVRAHETLRLDPEDRFYGLGERFERLDRTGRAIEMWPRNAYGARSTRSHKCIPLLWTPRGYGVFVDTAKHAVFHIGAKSNRTWTIEVPGDEIDYYFLAGAPADVLAAYARLTGTPAAPPVWAFGLWISTSYQPASEQSVLAKSARYRALDVPADVMTLDCTWQREMKYCDLEWDPASFPDPARLVGVLHDDHFKVCLWENPYVSVFSEAFEEGRAREFFLRQPDGAVYTPRLWAEGRMGYCGIVDFTNPRAAAWWRDKHLPLLDAGVDAFKTDFGEEIPEDAVFHDGRTGAEMRGTYAGLFQRAVFEVVREFRGHGLIWGRAGYAGMQRFPAHWSGDPQCTYEDMAATIRAGLSAGMSGLPMWSHDIGGFWGTPTPDLYVRWAQFGLLSTLSRCHGLTHRDPWEFGDEAVEIFRRYARLRYTLVPYLYSAALDAARTGLPVMRAMALAHPGDPGSHAAELQYYLGDSLLVAPVTRADGRVRVYLPAGRWIDIESGEAVDGGRVIERRCALREMPIYLPQDRILPLGPGGSWVDAAVAEPAAAEVFARDRAEIVVLGDGFARGMRARRAGDAISFEADAGAALTVRFRRAAAPDAVTLDDAPAPRVQDESAFQAAPGAWRVEGASVVVKGVTRSARLEGAPEI